MHALSLRGQAMSLCPPPQPAHQCHTSPKCLSLALLPLLGDTCSPPLFLQGQVNPLCPPLHPTHHYPTSQSPGPLLSSLFCGTLNFTPCPYQVRQTHWDPPTPHTSLSHFTQMLVPCSLPPFRKTYLHTLLLWGQANHLGLPHSPRSLLQGTNCR